MNKSTSLEWSPCVAGRFAQCDAKRLSLFQMSAGQDRRAIEVASRGVQNVNCMAWGQHISSKDLLVYGTPSGSVTMVDWAEDTDQLVNTPLKYGTRPCTSVAWSPQAEGHIAASFDKVRSEFCTMVWDIGHAAPPKTGASGMSTIAEGKMLGSGLTPIFQASYQEAASCVAWMPNERNVLLVGTAFGYIRIFDLSGGRKNEAGSIAAHKKGSTSSKQRGLQIRASPFDDNVIATFTDTPGDAVKVYDIRRLDSSFKLTQAVAVVAPVDASNRVLTEVQWSPVRRGVLGVATAESSIVSFYDISRAVRAEELTELSGYQRANESTQATELTVVTSSLFEVNAGPIVRDISWSHGQHQLQSRQDDGDPRPRLLIGTDTRVFDLPVVETVPLAVGRDEVVYCGASVEVIPLHSSLTPSPGSQMQPHSSAISPRSDPDGYAYPHQSNGTPLSPSMESHRRNGGGWSDPSIGAMPDMDALMRRRALAGYGLDGTRNARILSRELDDIPYSAHAIAGLTIKQERTSGLLRVWDWLARVETLQRDQPELLSCLIGSEPSTTSLRANAEAAASALGAPSTFSIDTCGVLRLVGMRASTPKLHPLLCTTTFDSKRRNLARALCGWCETLEVGGGQDATSGMSDGEDDDDGNSEGRGRSSSSSSSGSTSSTSSSSSSSSSNGGGEKGEGIESEASDDESVEHKVGTKGKTASADGSAVATTTSVSSSTNISSGRGSAGGTKPIKTSSGGSAVGGNAKIKPGTKGEGGSGGKGSKTKATGTTGGSGAGTVGKTGASGGEKSVPASSDASSVAPASTSTSTSKGKSRTSRTAPSSSSSLSKGVKESDKGKSGMTVDTKTALSLTDAKDDGGDNEKADQDFDPDHHDGGDQDAERTGSDKLLTTDAWRKRRNFGPVTEIVEESEIMDSFERAAALALFHGNPELAVCVLQRNVLERRRALGNSPRGGAGGARVDDSSRRGGHWSIATSLHNGNSNGNGNGNGLDTLLTAEGEQLAWHEQVTEDYLQVASLVAMGVAGFMNIAQSQHKQVKQVKRSRARHVGVTDSASEMWRGMMGEVLRQLKNFSRPTSCYLSAMCHFMLCNLGGTVENDRVHSDSQMGLSADLARQAAYHKHIMEDARITLEDR